MNGRICLTLCALPALLGVSQAIFFTGAALGAGTTTTLAISGSGVALGGALLGGLALLKAGALIKGAAGRRRGRRSVASVSVSDRDNEDRTFALVAAVEPSACYRRLICDLATGQMDKSQNDVLLSLFDDDEDDDKRPDVSKPKFEYEMAAKFGKYVKQIESCEVRYSCPLSGKELSGLF